MILKAHPHILEIATMFLKAHYRTPEITTTFLKARRRAPEIATTIRRLRPRAMSITAARLVPEYTEDSPAYNGMSSLHACAMCSPSPPLHRSQVRIEKTRKKRKKNIDRESQKRTRSKIETGACYLYHFIL